MRYAVAQREPELFAPPPIMPWDYIRLRREAAGLTIEQAATRFYARDEHRAGVIANLTLFEMPGIKVKRIEDVDLQRAFPFDAQVYRCLVHLPPERHPTLCLACGWDQWTSAVDLNGHDVSWSEEMPGRCTRCEQLAARKRK